MTKNNIEGLGDFDSDFYNQNPMMKLLPQSRAVIHTLGQAQASKYAWAMVLLYHIESPFHRLDSKVRDIAEGFLQQEEEDLNEFVNSADYYDFIDEIKSNIMTPLEYELSLNLDAIKKARRLAFDSTKSSEITAYLEKTPKVIRELMALQTDIIKANKEGGRERKTNANQKYAKYEKVITRENQEYNHDEDDDED
jgi:hypothetical protein